MKSKKDKIIVAVTGVALTIVFLVALIIGDASGLKVDDSTNESKSQVANNENDSDTSEGESDNSEADTSQLASDNVGETSSSTEEPSEEPSSEEETTAPPEEKTEIFLVNLSDYVNVRAAGSTDAEILGKIYAGGGGEVIERGDQWTKIKSGEVEGYVVTEYIWIGEEAEAHLPTHGTIIGTITTTDLRIRDAAGLDSDVLGYLDINSEVTVLEEGDEWHKIEFQGDEAYIAAEYVTIRYEYSLAITIAEEQAAIKAEEERQAALAAEAAKKEEENAARLATALTKYAPFDVQRAALYTNITDEEIYLMMCVVSCECGHDVYEGQLAVANLMLNRYNGHGYGDTMKDVLYAPNQFSVVLWDSFQVEVERGPLESSQRAVLEAISGVNNVPRYTNYRSLTGIDDSDYEIMNEWEVIGNQVFYNRK